MATSIPDLLMRHSKIDYVVVGEGEETIKHLLIALMNRTDTREVKGIYGKDASEIFSTGYRPRIKLLSASHKTPYEIFDIDKYVNYLLETERCWEIITSRGCYGKCNFCHRSFGKHITYRDLSEVVNEMKFIKNKYNIDRFSFVDDNFLINERRAEEFICILKNERQKFKFRFQGRVDKLGDINIIKNLKRVGCFDICYGIESGSQEIIDYMGKNININNAKENINKVLASDINVHASFIIGMPIESSESIDKTIQFIKETEIKNVNAGILTLFPGSDLYNYAIERKYIKDEDEYCEKLGEVYEQVHVNLTDYDDEQLIQWKNDVKNSCN